MKRKDAESFKQRKRVYHQFWTSVIENDWNSRYIVTGFKGKLVVPQFEIDEPHIYPDSKERKVPPAFCELLQPPFKTII